MVVNLVEDFDLYNFKYGDLTKGFKEWSNYNDTNPVDIIWDKLLTSNYDQLEELAQEGLKFEKIRLYKLYEDINRLGYESEIDGIKCFKMNLTQNDCISDAGDYVINVLGYDLFWAYSDALIGNKIQRTNQLRSHVIDVSKLADKFGGGGHERAAGFLSDIGERKGGN
jgi:nanoRNase/pAp phosphatase (c-di-AMP/oligoRNAs hydrolase)